ncbi:MAG: hypothetical protein JXA11_17225 [Phycisphaerae bacterium]|nr:hypothetical protein [Phycisphaerae bacterium]
MSNSNNGKPRVLCMADLSLVPTARQEIQTVAHVDYMPANPSRLPELIGRYDAFWGHVDCKLNKAVLARAGNLKVIATASTGTDHIDKAECQRRGIKVLSITRDYDLLDTFTATAECAWMLLLNCMRHFRSAHRAVLDEGRFRGEDFIGRQLSRRTLGVLGLGRLGKMVVEYGKAFRMRVLGCDWKDIAIPGVEKVDFETLLRQSDCISIHIHLTEENRNLFDSTVLGKMKAGAVLVNTSRGDIIDEQALLAALQSGTLSAFGADVLHDEWRTDMRESPVVRYAQDHDNVVLTPHIGGCTDLSIRDARIFTAKKLASYISSMV